MASGISDDQVRESLTSALEPGEQLRAVGVFTSYSKGLHRWSVGITDERLIVEKQMTEKDPEDAMFTLALEHVVIVRDPIQLQLKLASADPKVPKLLVTQKGGNQTKDEFKNTRDEFKKLVTNRVFLPSGVSDDQIRVSLTPALEPGEQLRAVGLFLADDLTKHGNWWVGITDKRLIVAKQGWATENVVQDAMFTVPLENAGIKRRVLPWQRRWFLLHPGSPDPKVPKRLISQKGGKKKRAEFKKWVTSHP